MELKSAGAERVLVKLGGSLITDKSRPYTARLDVIARLCAEIHEARQERRLALVVGHGGGSFPHVSAARYQTQRGVIGDESWAGFVKVHDDAMRLNAILCEELGRAGELALPVPPSAAAVARKGRIHSWPTGPIAMLMDAGVVPVPFGDVCLDEEQGFCIVSTEEIFRFLAGPLRAERIIMVGKVDGVLDEEGRVIPEITTGSFDDIRGSLKSSDGIADVTGGMVHKVESSLRASVRTEIINGDRPGLLRRALLGEPGLGTLILP